MREKVPGRADGVTAGFPSPDAMRHPLPEGEGITD